MKTPMKKKKQTSITVNPRIHNEIRRIAKEERRSVSGQIALFLEQAVARRGTEAVAKWPPP